MSSTPLTLPAVLSSPGVVPEYLVAAKRYLGDADGAAFVAGTNPRPVMTRIDLRPDWAKVMEMRH